MIIARAPFGLPLAGNGTDLPAYYSRHGGFFVSAAIDKYVYVSVNCPAADELIRVKYSQSEEVQQPAAVQHDLVREALLALQLSGSIEITSIADVPSGTGMGDSGSYVVALLLALHALKRDHLPTWALAEEAGDIEIQRARHAVGKQHHQVAAWGGINGYEVSPDGKVVVTPVRIAPDAVEDLQRRFLLYFTGRRQATGAQAPPPSGAGGVTVHDVDCLHRARERGFALREALEAGDLARVGALLDQEWQSERAGGRTSRSMRADRAYAVAREHGALGGRLMAAREGGFLLLLAGRRSTRRIREAVAAEGLQQVPFSFDLEGAKVLLNIR